MHLFFRQSSWIPLPPWKRCHCPTLVRNLASHTGRQIQTSPLEQRMEPRRGVSRRSRNKPSLLMGCCHLVLPLLSMAEVFSQAGKTPTKACKKRRTSGSPWQHCPPAARRSNYRYKIYTYVINVHDMPHKCKKKKKRYDFFNNVLFN